MDIDKELEDIFNDPLLGVTYEEAKLFDIPADMKKVMERKRLQPDHYAQTKQCEEFHLYKPMFEKVQHELNEGKRSLMKTSKTSNLDVGHFYVVSGMLVYLAEIGETKRNRNSMLDGRTRCIYENGTENDILLETLRRNVLHDGYGVTEPQENIDNNFFNTTLAEGDTATGYVYVLRSLSPDPRIANEKDLYKIGFTTKTVEERIANAENEPTYLMAPVQIMTTAQIVNMNSFVFESLVHQFFSAVQFQFTVYDEAGQEHTPSEWYKAPLEIIEKVIEKITDGSIKYYTYNAEQKVLEKHVVKNVPTFNTKGLHVLTLSLKQKELEAVVSGEKTTDERELKQTTLNKFTYVDGADKKRYLRRYDAIRFYAGSQKSGDSVLMEVKDIKHDGLGTITFHLGQLLEYIRNSERSNVTINHYGDIHVEQGDVNIKTYNEKEKS